MARKRHTAEQIIRRLREGEVLINKGMTAAEAVRKLGRASTHTTVGGENMGACVLTRQSV